MSDTSTHLLGSSILTNWISPFIILGMSVFFLLGGGGCNFFLYFWKFYANNIYPDQTLHSMVSDLGLHCLPMSFSWTLSID